MQEPTHILAGVIIQRAIFWRGRRWFLYPVVAVLAFLSHGILDKLANVTYHRAHADFHSVVWVSYHLLILAATIFFLCVWWRRFWWGIVFAMLPDLDWVFIHGQEFFGIQPFYRAPYMHRLLGWVLARIPGLGWLDHLPNNRENPWAMSWEFLLVAGMLGVIRAMNRAQRSVKVN